MRDALRRLDGLFVGQLNADELELFEYCVKKGWARRSFEGGMGFMGCARVRLVA